MKANWSLFLIKLFGLNYVLTNINIKVYDRGDISSLTVRSMGGYEVKINGTGIFPQNQIKMINLFKEYYRQNPEYDSELTAGKPIPYCTLFIPSVYSNVVW